MCKAFVEVMRGLKYDKSEYYYPKEFIRIMESQDDLFSALKSVDPKVLFFILIDYILIYYIIIYFLNLIIFVLINHFLFLIHFFSSNFINLFLKLVI